MTGQKGKVSNAWTRKVSLAVSLAASLALAQTSLAAGTMKAAVVTGGAEDGVSADLRSPRLVRCASR